DRAGVGVVTELGRSLPTGSRLRLDANGGLHWQEACRWLEACDALFSPRCQVEFLEQPLPPSDFAALLKLQSQYQTAIALDESVTTIAQLTQCYAAGWRGLFVIKAAIAGFPNTLRQFCRQPGVEVIWSSALETAIARQFIQTRLIPSVGTDHRAVGFGIDHWFTEDGLNSPDPEEIWQRLTPT
ncbi:MAG: o-succinylbenzoate synthase, partial [Leptolyngbyaceae cyanobacterium SL_7_1]|nr:o-succinylbenzoate synthase [Leptolyngbyaceae cyanobacterium SL_7_1]